MKITFKTRQVIELLFIILIAPLFTGCMSIQTAARFGNMGEVKKQLAWGVNPNTRTLAYRISPLHEAVGSGYTNITQLLLDKGADVNIKDEGGATPLHWAAQNGNTKVMEIKNINSIERTA